MPKLPVEPAGKISRAIAPPVHAIQLSDSARSRPAPFTIAAAAVESLRNGDCTGPGLVTLKSHADSIASITLVLAMLQRVLAYVRIRCRPRLVLEFVASNSPSAAVLR